MTTPRAAVALMVTANMGSMVGVFAFPALLPAFMAEWSLSSGEAGFITGVFMTGYALAAAFLTSLTDRVDARRVVLAFAVVGVLANLGFAGFATGFWSALGWRLLAGVALAGTFMPGMRALADRIEGPFQARAVALYVSSFSLGTGVSFLLAGEIGGRLRWEWAFVAAAVWTTPSSAPRRPCRSPSARMPPAPAR